MSSCQDLAQSSAKHAQQQRLLALVAPRPACLCQLLESVREGLKHCQKQLERCDPAVCISTAAVGAAGLGEQQLVSAMVELQTLLDYDSRSSASGDYSTESLEANLAAPPNGRLTEAKAVKLLTAAGGPELPQHLIDLGAALCAALPVPYCCNNPLCDNLGKLTELELVGGENSVCSGCLVARYCGRDCQTAHWKQHKQSCSRIKRSRFPS